MNFTNTTSMTTRSGATIATSTNPIPTALTAATGSSNLSISSSTTPLAPMTTVQVLSNEIIEPIWDATLANFKRLQSDLERFAANGRQTDRNNLIVPVKDIIEIQFKVREEYEVNWLDWSNEKLFQLLFKIFPQNGTGSGDGSVSSTDLVLNSVKRMRFKGIEKFSMDDSNRFNESWIHNTTKLVDTSTFPPETIKLIIKEAIDIITKDRHTEHAKAVASYVRTQVKQRDPKTLADFPVQLGMVLHNTKMAIEIGTLCGMSPNGALNHTNGTHANPNREGQNHRDSHKRSRDNRTPQRTNTTTPDGTTHTQGTQATTATTVTCAHCGRNNHASVDCRGKFHPNHNPDATVTWANSHFGKLFKEKNIEVLPFKTDINGVTLTNVPTTLVPARRTNSTSNNTCECECNNISYYDNDNNTDTISCTIHINSQSPLNCEALVDTGALKANYISVHKAENISKLLHTYVDKSVVCKTCTPFNGMCLNTIGTICIDITYFNEILNKFETINDIYFKVIDMKYDMIIGKPTIKQHDLTIACRSQFVEDSKYNIIPITTTNYTTITDSILPLNDVTEYAELATITAGRRRVQSKRPVRNINKEIRILNNNNVSNCYCEYRSDQHDKNVWSYWASTGEPVISSYTNKDTNKHTKKIYKHNNIVSSIPAESAGVSANVRSGHRPSASYDSSVLTCCSLDGTDDTKYLRKHVHELLGEKDDIDELTKEKINNNEINPWDLYSKDSTSNNDNSLPTNVHSMTERHNALFNKYKHIFSRKVRDEPASLPPLKLQVNDEGWNSNKHRLPPRPQSLIKEEEILRQTNEMLKNKVITHSQATEWSQVMLAPKPPDKWRFCVDYKYLNAVTKGLGYPIPLIAAIKDRISRKKARFFAGIDLTSGYHQIGLDKESRIYTAFRTLNALYEFTRIPFGLKGAPSWFQYLMATIVLIGILYICVELYLDDMLIFGATEDEYFYNLEQVFIRLEKYHLLVNPDKGYFGMPEVKFIGHHFTQEGVTHCKDRINVVLNVPKPTYAKQLKSFIGVVEYFHEHIKNCANLLRPMRKLIQPYSKTHTIKWTEEATQAFEQIKIEINKCPTLYFLDNTAPIYLHTDASDYGIGAYLFQVVDGTERPVMFMSKGLSPSEIKWKTIDKECYAIAYALYKFKHLLQSVHFTLRTDHNNLIYLRDSKSERVQRMKADIQEYDFDIEHIDGVRNIAADAFSRIVELDNEQLNALDTDIISAISSDTIPRDKYKLIATVHNSIVGHHGLERTVAKLKSKLSTNMIQEWTYMRQQIKSFIKKCPCCQKMSVIKTPINTLKYTLSTYAPMQRVSIDTINFNIPDINGNTAVIVIIDCFSRWVELYAAQDYTALSAAQALLNFIGRYGVPADIHSDRGTQYLNDLLSQLYQLMGTGSSFNISSYSHEENAMVERSIKEVQRHLRALIFDKNVVSDWSNNLPIVQRILNASDCESIGTSPAKILFGNSIDLDRNIFLPIDERPIITDMAPWLAERLSAQDAIISKAIDKQLKSNNQHIATTVYDNAKYEYAVGDYVLVDYPTSDNHKGAPNKLLTNRKGPMKITNKNGDHYTLLDLTNNTDTMKRHVKYLHPFYYDAEYTNPRQIANKDNQSYDIDKILDHSGNKKWPSYMKFKVQWMPINNLPAEVTWEPWKMLRSTIALHAYLNENGMKNLIPKVYK